MPQILNDSLFCELKLLDGKGRSLGFHVLTSLCWMIVEVIEKFLDQLVNLHVHWYVMLHTVQLKAFVGVSTHSDCLAFFVGGFRCIHGVQFSTF